MIFTKKNLPRSPFAFIFIVRKLKYQAVFREYYHQKTRSIKARPISSTN